MLLRPLTHPLPIHLQVRGRESLEPLAGLNAQEQLEVACRNVVGILRAARPRFERNREDREAYDALCNAVEEWFQGEIASYEGTGFFANTILLRFVRNRYQRLFLTFLPLTWMPRGPSRKPSRDCSWKRGSITCPWD